jgi:hypothetical protein
MARKKIRESLRAPWELIDAAERGMAPTRAAGEGTGARVGFAVA